MNPFKMLGTIVLSILGKKEFDTDESGHLVLSAEEAEKLDSQMKFAAGSFSQMFKDSFDSAVEANEGGSADNHELVVNALMDTMRKHVEAELNLNKEAITAELQNAFNEQLANLTAEKKTAEQKAAELEAANTELLKQNGILASRTEDDQAEGVTKPVKQDKNMGTFSANKSHFHNKMAFDFLSGNSSAAIIAMTNQSFGNKTMGGGPSDTIDVSEINEEFGSYLADQATRMTIYKEMLKPTESRQYMTKVLALTEWRDAMARIDSVVQQFVAKWTPLGKTTITPLKIVNRRHKVNLPIIPDDITGGYLTYLYNEGVTPDQMPVTKYIIDELLRPRIADDIEYKMIATGVFEELTPSDVDEGDPGQAPEKSMDGFLTILNTESASPTTKVNFWTPTVAWSEDNSVEYFEAYAKWVKKTNPTLAKVGMNVFADPDMAETRAKKYRELFPLTKNTDMDNMKIDFSNLTILPLENMRGSGVIFATPKVNFIELHHINEASGATKLFLQLMNYEVRIFGEFWLSVGFAVAEWIFAAVGATEESGSGA
jgi:hypothetical protein